MAFRIKTTLIDGYIRYIILNENEYPVCEMKGAMGGMMALAACEALNGETFVWDGWTVRLDNLIRKEP